MQSSMSFIAQNIASVTRKIETAALSSGRDPDTVTLIAVSKTHPIQAIEAALKAGQRVFGENRVQEAAAKFPPLKLLYPDLELHLIGPLQTNKAAQAVALFDGIQTLDRLNLAEVLAKEMAKQDRFPRLYIEVNLGREPQKAGVTPEDLPFFLKACTTGLGLKIDGLMCIPPQGQDPEPYFDQLALLAEQSGLPRCSMGMSGDYETAIAHGATEVRVGTALFGERGSLL